MAEGQKISEMTEVSSLLDACCFPVLSEGNNRRITKANLFNTLVKPTTDALNESVETVQDNIDTLSETVSGLESDVEDILNKIYPIGCKYVSSVNPSTWLTGTTWTSKPVAYGYTNSYMEEYQAAGVRIADRISQTWSDDLPQVYEWTRTA